MQRAFPARLPRLLWHATPALQFGFPGWACTDGYLPGSLWLSNGSRWIHWNKLEYSWMSNTRSSLWQFLQHQKTDNGQSLRVNFQKYFIPLTWANTAGASLQDLASKRFDVITSHYCPLEMRWAHPPWSRGFSGVHYPWNPSVTVVLVPSNQ